MQTWQAIKFICGLFILILSLQVNAAELNQSSSMDRLALVTQQIDLLKSRYDQVKNEITHSQKDENLFLQYANDKDGKNLLERISLDISVAKSSLDSVNIELADSQQTINWLEKNIQEIENQLNIFSIFGAKITRQEVGNLKQYKEDLAYQKKLLKLEKTRISYLQNLQNVARQYLGLKLYILFPIIAFSQVSCTPSGPNPPQIAANLIQRQQVTTTTKTHYAAEDPTKIDVYTPKVKPLTPYRIIGYATVSRYNLIGKHRDDGSIQIRMKQLAASIGGDGIMNLSEHDNKVKAKIIQYQRILI